MYIMNVCMNMKMKMTKDVESYCARKKGTNILYNNLVTGGNDPSISKKMKYSQYLKTTRVSYIPSSDYILKYGF
jgi:hypothetical protein